MSECISRATCNFCNNITECYTIIQCDDAVTAVCADCAKRAIYEIGHVWGPGEHIRDHKIERRDRSMEPTGSGRVRSCSQKSDLI